mmetsp:Transcript_25743/g.66594  ORF Transcript_25743/g.66594 Transcript_25743/m.66594 type:complete len:96 (+) Transcript_25743:664-951(+)
MQRSNGFGTHPQPTMAQNWSTTMTQVQKDKKQATTHRTRRLKRRHVTKLMPLRQHSLRSRIRSLERIRCAVKLRSHPLKPKARRRGDWQIRSGLS